MMRPQSVTRPKEVDVEDTKAGKEKEKDPATVKVVVADSKRDKQESHDGWDFKPRQSAKKEHQFVHASAIYMPYLAYSSHCGALKGIKDPKLKKAHEDYEGLLESYKGKDDQQHGSPTLDEWYYQFAQDDKEATDDQKQRNKSQVVSKYLKENEDGSSASKLNQWTVVRVNQLWIWTIADNWIITSTSSLLDNSSDVLVDDILNLLSKKAEYGGSRAQPVSATQLVPFIIDYCIGSYDRRPNNTGRISIGQTFSHYINRIGRNETNLFNDFRNGLSYENEKKKLNSKLHNHSGVAEAAIGGAIANAAETKPTAIQPQNHNIVTAIQQAKDLCFNIKDVRDELNILKSVAGYQQIVQSGLDRKEVDESRLASTYVLKNLKELDDVAERIQSAVRSNFILLGTQTC
ncbi:ankyrin protein [Fusarium globosum]|uniref:Ankyrin protein n=1 Tax=Fusarium globosum TaxID=78864 RepID=A0A8H5XQP9_9HYPO|nr:ankyrin protein [Fusarium globosum]